MSELPDFNWQSETIAVAEQDAIAVYANERGAVVIRAQCWPDDDPIIIVALQNVTSLLQAIVRASGLPLELVRCVGPGSYVDVDEPHEDLAEGRPDADISVSEPAPPKDVTAAERQRRHRGKRNGVTVTPVVTPVTPDVTLFATAGESHDATGREASGSDAGCP
jgi:hypothetical protein